MASSVSTQARNTLIASIVLTVLLFSLPHPYNAVFGWPLVLISTVAHELGHGLAAILVGNRFHALIINYDASGLAHHSGPAGALGQAFVAAGGLVGPAVAAAGLFLLGRKPRVARFGLFGIGIFLAVVDVFFVRNLFGFFFVGSLAVIATYIAARRSEDFAQLTVVFVAVQLALSVYARSDYLFTDVAHMATGDVPSDVAHMANGLLLPYWVWGGVCGGFSALVLVFGVWSFLRSGR